MKRTKITDKQIIILYKDGYTITQISKKFHISNRKVSYILKKHNIYIKHSQFIDLSNQTINNWKILKLNPIKTKNRCWICQCILCGKIYKSIRTQHLLSNNSTKCKNCAAKNNRTGYADISGSFFSAYKSSAKKRNIPFKITAEYAWKIFIQQNKKCAITGQLLNLYHYNTKMSRKNITASIDRIDNTKGYIEGNIWWIHKDINQIKWTRSITELITQCELIVKNQNNILYPNH